MRGGILPTFRAVLGLVLLCGSALATETKPPLMVLELDAKGASTLQAEAATLSVARGIRELDVFSVLSSADVRQLLAIERSKQLVTGSSAPGLSALGTALGASHAVVGTVVRMSDGNLQVELRLLDTVSSKVISQKAFGPASMDKQAQALPGLAQELLGPLLQSQRGELLVRSREEAAEVWVDDALLASLPMLQPVKLPRGSHRLQLRKNGFIATTRNIRIEPNQLRVEEVTLLPSPEFAEAFKKRNTGLRVGAALATAGAALAVTGAVLLDRLSTDPLYRQEFVPRQAWLAEHTGTTLEQTGGSQFANDPKALTAYQSCVGQAQACRDRATQLQNQIRLQQYATIGLGVLGAAAAATAVYLFVIGDDPNRYSNVTAGVSFDNTGATVAVSGRF
jgi:hypothetical protein